MFDIDYLTDSMNYIPVSLDNQSNPHAGTSEVTNSVGTLQSPNTNASEEVDEDEELLVVPIAIKHSAAKNEAFSTGISEDTPEILAFRRDLDQLAQKHLREVTTDKATSTNSVNSASYDKEGMVHDFNNLPTEVAVSPIPTLRIHNIHPKSQILGDPKSSVQTRSKGKQTSGAHALEEPKKISEALKNDSWVKAMQEELNKRDERGVVVRSKARLVAQGHRHEEGIAPVARIEAIRLFLAFASFMGFIVYQMNVKSTFMYGTIDEEVYVSQPPGFVDPNHPKKVYKVVKALYGLHQALRAWDKKDIMLVQVYVDDIIFGST
ncbi:putative ribonuclease H-like domain-containing protein, partial [Tanacetum coccineum]